MATLTKGKTFTNGELVTPQKLHELVDLGSVANIVNADISAGAAIADTKLAAISTANKVANSATTAASANTANAIVARDGSGNFSAGTITANLAGNANTATTCSGNAATATTLQTARTINGIAFNGSANITVTAAPDAHSHDDRYYTETEMNTLLAGKQAAGSYAPATGIAPSAIAGTAVITTDARLSEATASSSGLMPAADKEYIGIMKSSAPSITYTGGGGSGLPSLSISSTYLWSGDDPQFDKLNGIILDGHRMGGTGMGGFCPCIDIYNHNVATTTGNSTPYLRLLNSNDVQIGSITRNNAGTGVAYNTTSDYRLKTNIEPLTDAVARLLQIPAHRFNWLADPSGQKVDGFLAHEAQAVVPEAVTGTKDAVDADGKPIYQGIDQSKLVPLLVAAVQELAARIAVLENK